MRHENKREAQSTNLCDPLKTMTKTRKELNGVWIPSAIQLRYLVNATILLWVYLSIRTLMSLKFSMPDHLATFAISSHGDEKNLISRTDSIPFIPSRTRNRIPLPLPSKKVSVVLMNYSRPRMIRESSLMRTLLAHPNVGEVVLLHSNPKTRFDFVHEKVLNVDATQENDEMGLALRFYFCQLVKYDWVLHVDDDMEFSLETLSELLIEFNRNPKRLVGRFGRNLKTNSFFNGYSSRDAHLVSEVILTKFMVMKRDLCSAFFEYSHLVWDDLVLDEGEGPFWNGEDIFMSLVANFKYGHKANYAMDWLKVNNAPDHLKDYDNGNLDISGGMKGISVWSWHWWQSLLRRNRHYSYRGKLWKTTLKRLEMLKSENDEAIGQLRTAFRLNVQ